MHTLILLGYGLMGLICLPVAMLLGLSVVWFLEDRPRHRLRAPARAQTGPGMPVPLSLRRDPWPPVLIDLRSGRDGHTAPLDPVTAEVLAEWPAHMSQRWALHKELLP